MVRHNVVDALRRGQLAEVRGMAGHATLGLAGLPLLLLDLGAIGARRPVRIRGIAALPRFQFLVPSLETEIPGSAEFSQAPRRMMICRAEGTNVSHSVSRIVSVRAIFIM